MNNMFFVKISCLLGLSLWGVFGQNGCPDNVYRPGLTTADRNLILSLHNKYRKNICDGKVPGQPRGKGLLKLLYHYGLQRSAKLVSDRCKLGHIIVPVDKWKSIGQNLYEEYQSSYNPPDSNWTKAINSFYNEYRDYKYEKPRLSNNVYQHYTQVVWAETNYIGCDYIFFNSSSNSLKERYTKLYTCNYGPPGNVNENRPYIKGNEGCPQLN